MRLRPFLRKYIEQSSMYGMVWHGMVCMYTCRYVGMYVCMYVILYVCRYVCMHVACM